MAQAKGKTFKFVLTKPCKFIGFGAMDVTKPYKFIGFGAMDVTKPYEFTGFGAKGKTFKFVLFVLFVVLAVSSCLKICIV